VSIVGKNVGDNQLSIVVADDGVGFPKGKDFAASSSLGLQLVHILADQLNGKVGLVPGAGTKIELTFELDR
jgi:two-component sensor histidine kinase